MKAKPIIFSGPMVRAILDGTKTQTRRVIKPQYSDATFVIHEPDLGVALFRGPTNLHSMGRKAVTCPYRPGDLLYVREKFTLPAAGGCSSDHPGRSYSLIYAADEGKERFPIGGNWVQRNHDFKWRPSIFMPRVVSRLTLRISRVRAELLQDITVQDIMAEGIRMGAIDGQPHYLNPTWCENVGNDFVELWDSINAKRPGCSWADNPWCWVLEWDRVWQQNVDDVMRDL